MARAIMLQGTASDVGKSVLVAGLCRIFYQDGYRVAPFKSQNMALNSGITTQGDEMGRAQIFQAEAAGIAPDVRMNPVLLKPTSDRKSQVIVMGKVFRDMDAVSYHQYKPQLLDQVVNVYHELAAENDVVVIEGAGSPAEINLRDRDIVNMGLAERIDAPVILVADIDRGGVFAAIYGTLALLQESERQRVKGVIINKFRGDVTLLKSGIDQIEALTGVPILGVMPMLDLNIEDEDSVALSQAKYRKHYTDSHLIDIAVIQLPHIANFSDFNALALQAEVNLRYIKRGEAIGKTDLVILPGSKNTLADLAYLRQSGLAEEIDQLRETGVGIIGICGGYQMLSQKLYDGIESGIEEMAGLALLDCETRFAQEKTTVQVNGQITAQSGLCRGSLAVPVQGYEIHMGQTRLGANAQPFSRLSVASTNGESQTYFDGAVSPDGNVIGTYIHGIFDDGQFTCRLLNVLRERKGLSPLDEVISYHQIKQREYDKLAQAMREHLDMARIYQIMIDPSHPHKSTRN